MNRCYFSTQKHYRTISSIPNQYKHFKDKSLTQIPQKFPNSIKDPLHAYSGSMFQNPHFESQRIQIAQVKTKNDDINVEGRLQINDIQFWKNKISEFTDLRIFLEANVFPPKAESKLAEKSKKNTKNKYAQIGHNIIKINQSTVFKHTVSNKMSFCEGQNSLLIARGDFEGGNLNECIQIQNNKYIILLNNDTNTKGYNQWFHFYLQMSATDNQDYHFFIPNITKPIRFEKQMKLLTRKRNQQNYSQNWQRQINFSFLQTNIKKQNQQRYWGISFTLLAQELRSGIFVALTYPYPYSRLKLLSEQLVGISEELSIFEIGKSSFGNCISVFKVSKPSKNKKKNLVIIARQHASQSSSSFICQYILKKLVYFNLHENLLTQFDCHIIPMVNPDGTIHGNSRSSGRGYDINRCWAPYLLYRSPEAQAITNYLSKIGVECDDIFIDLHGHSREIGCFSYFVNENQFSQFFSSKMKQLCPSYCIEKCKYGYENEKRSTFRVQMNSRLKIKRIVTFEASFYGWVCNETQKLIEYKTSDYEKMAESILDTLEFYAIQNKQNFVSQKIDQKSETKENIQQNIGDDSDTDPQGDYLNNEERRQVEQEQKNKKQEANISKQMRSENVNDKRKFNLTTKSLVIRNKKNHSPKISAIVNIFQGSKENNQKQQISKNKRSFSITLKPDSHSLNSSQNIPRQFVKKNTRKQLQGRQFKSKGSESNNVRQSFRNLFASAQLRNNNMSYSDRNDRNNRNDSILKNEQEETSFNKGSLNASIQNFYFPIGYKYDSYLSERQFKVFESNPPKKKISKGVSYQNQKRVESVYQKSTNEKIQKLCEFAKNIDKFLQLN